MLNIDGSFGEGGGQIIRSSLALALVTGRPFTIDNIRARRQKPGLRQQHLTAVHAAAEVGEAEVRGASLGSARLEFRPGGVRPGDYHFDVGTAGSTTLVLQTILPALLAAASESTIELRGGTHNPLAPPFDFLARAYLPLVNHLGPQVTAVLDRHGFFPAGGGQIRARVGPCEQLGRLELVDRGAQKDCRATVLLARLARHIGQRECRTVAEHLGWDESQTRVVEVGDSRGPGNVVLIELEFEHVTEIFAAFGERGVPAETVARRAAEQAQSYLDAGVPVGEHLADQLLLPLAIAAWKGTGGGRFRTTRLSLHSTTHIELLKQFMELAIDVESQGENDCLVRFAGSHRG
jgi:RNA 3'-terminal phosphate cyclase (ATP)